MRSGRAAVIDRSVRIRVLARLPVETRAGTSFHRRRPKKIAELAISRSVFSRAPQKMLLAARSVWNVSVLLAGSRYGVVAADFPIARDDSS
jgi:hypothetical protein